MEVLPIITIIHLSSSNILFLLFRYLWALVHSNNFMDVQLGLDLCEEYLKKNDEGIKRDINYFKGGMKVNIFYTMYLKICIFI